MDPTKARRQSDEMVASPRASRPKNSKGKAKPSTLKVTDITGKDLSYLPFATMVLASSFRNVPLKINTKVSLKPMGSSRCWAP